MMKETANRAFNFEELKSLIAEVFKIDVGNIDEELAFGDIPAWDSLGHMDLLMALEARYQIELDETLISDLTSVGAIVAHLRGASNGR